MHEWIRECMNELENILLSNGMHELIRKCMNVIECMNNV